MKEREIAIIHTVQSVADTFGRELKAYLGDAVPVKIYNLWDEFLSVNPNEIGEFTQVNRNRLFQDFKVCEETGAELIVVSCSTLTPHLAHIRPFIRPRIIAIDDAMDRKAVAVGENILAMATAGSALGPTVDKLNEEARKAGKEIRVTRLELPEAFAALKVNDMDRHDAILREEATKLTASFDCIVLAQASMAPMEEEIARITGTTVLSSPRLCMEEIRQALC